MQNPRTAPNHPDPPSPSLEALRAGGHVLSRFFTDVSNIAIKIIQLHGTNLEHFGLAQGLCRGPFNVSQLVSPA
jgi:hypothetical protein